MVLDALLKTLHVLAVVLWVGGMVFAHFYLRPSLTEFDPPTRLALMCSVLKRFFGLDNYGYVGRCHDCYLFRDSFQILSTHG